MLRRSRYPVLASQPADGFRGQPKSCRSDGPLVFGPVVNSQHGRHANRFWRPVTNSFDERGGVTPIP